VVRLEENKKNEEQKETKSNQPKKVKVNNNSIVILRHRNINKTKVEELEKEYSDKFGCKVVILESNVDYVGKIDG
jgi:hypothetical protein